jgi:repressor LexA
MATKKAAEITVAELHDEPDETDELDQHGLTPRQLKILGVIKSALHDQGYPPSMREIGAAVGLTSTASVKYQLEILESLQPDEPGKVYDISLPAEEIIRRVLDAN